MDRQDSSSYSKIRFQGNAKITLKIAQDSQPQNGHDLCTQADLRKLTPEWLERFFKRNFSEPCSIHPIHRNGLNKYCIDCDATLCQYCVSLRFHAKHRLLKVYRHVYKDVVPLDEIERYMDCSKIQPYRCNRQMIIALFPLPHSGGKSKEEETCLTCRRRLIHYDIYRYCSIFCKVKAFLKKKNDDDPPFLQIDQAEKNTVLELELELEPEPEQELEPKSGPSPMKTRKRKGMPHRAPLS